MKRILLFFLTTVLLLPVCVGCGRTEVQSSEFFLMDTQITLTLYTRDRERASEIFAESRRMLTMLDRLWSRTKPESDVSRFNNEAELLEIDLHTRELIVLAQQISHVTDGAFDITVAALVELWQRCESEDRLPTEQELSDARAHVGYEQLLVSDNNTLSKSHPSVKIDLGGIGKGAAITQLLHYLERCEVRGGLVSFGSNIAVFGEKPDGKPFRIALRDPHDPAGAVGVLTLCAGEILSVSGGYERYVTIEGEKYHHILDPKTGYPAESGLASVAVVTHDGSMADALSTALFVMGEQAAMDFYRSGIYDFEAILIREDGSVLFTDGMAYRFAEN